MPDRPVVVDNTPLVALWTLGRLDLLRDLFEEVLIPHAVEEEFLAAETSARRQALAEATWIKRVELSHPRRALAYAGLDRGEAAAIALAEERDARLIILDERRARGYAVRMGMPITGTVGVLLLAKEATLIDSVKASISRLQEAGLFLTPSLIRKALEIAGESRSD